MILTNKAKEAFLDWYRKRLSVMTMSELLNINDITIFNALIIEWFDSVGIYIDCPPLKEFAPIIFGCLVNDKMVNNKHYYNRQQATEKAIEKANLIFNGDE